MLKFSAQLLGLVVLSGCGLKIETPPGTDTAAVTLEGGYETDPQDNGRPVALIGPALGVTPEIFRDAFSGVTPARDGRPSADHARANKRVLMDALGKHGIINERLDEVSNFYRYKPQDGGLWKHEPAKVVALVKDGKVVEFKIIDGGYGYTTPPRVSVEGMPNVRVTAKIGFGMNLEENGELEALTLVK